MTKDEFIQNAVALHGSSIGWQSSTARSLNIADRTVRRIVKGEQLVSEGIAKDLLTLLGEAAPQIIHAEWILGTGSDDREYLTHTRYPRFQCLVLENDSDYNFDKDAGVQYGFEDIRLCGFLWHDKIPENLTQVLERACDFIGDSH